MMILRVSDRETSWRIPMLAHPKDRRSIGRNDPSGFVVVGADVCANHSDSAEPRFVFFVRIRSTIPILQVWILNIYLGTRSMSIILPICQVHHFEIPNLPRADWEILNLPRADWEIPNLPRADWEIPNLPRADWEIPNLPKPPERIVPPGRLMLEDTLRRQSRRSARCSKMRACTHARTHTRRIPIGLCSLVRRWGRF